MESTSKTLTEAINEVLENLTTSHTFTISNLSKQLAESLNFNCDVYLPRNKSLRKISITKQSSNLYSATYSLVDDESKKKRA